MGESRAAGRRNPRGTDVKALKQLVRDTIDPGRDLGHIDRHASDEA